MLLVHGFTDYFFNTELADHFAGRGFAFYALDLHKCGRSWREGQTPHFTTDLARYDRELERALDLIAEIAGGPAVRPLRGRPHRVAVAGPAAPPRRHRRQAHHRPGAQQPVAGPAGPGDPAHRAPPAPIGAMSRIRKRRVVRPPTEGGYGTTLHRDYHGEFDYDLKWKPIGGFPVTFGWIHAIRRGQAKLHRGLDVGVPNLILRSDRSVREVSDPEGDDPARRRGARRQADRPVGRLHRQPHHDRADRRRQARRVPVAGRTAPGGLPRTGPLAGLVPRWPKTPAPQHNPNEDDTMTHFDIAIIGTGSGNTILDERYADKRVAICEQGAFGGTCLNVGCIPTKMFVYAAEVAQTVQDAARYGVDAHVDGVRWSDIVSRVFGRIDPIALGGENYRRVIPERRGVRQPHPVRPAAVRWPLHRCAPTTATSSPPTRW